MKSFTGKTLTFEYQVQDGDNTTDLDYVASNSLTLNDGDSIKASDGIDAVRTLPDPGSPHSLGDNAAIVVDTTSPTVTATARTSPTSDNTPTLRATVNDNSGGSGIKRVLFELQCKPNQTCVPSRPTWSSVGETTAPAQGSQYEVTVTETLSGTYQLRVTAEDQAGNTNDPDIIEFKVDATRPAQPTVSSPQANSTNNPAKPNIIGKAEAGSTVDVSEGGATICSPPPRADNGGDWNWAPDSNLSSGSHTITVTATDEAGNVSDPTTITFTVR